MAVPASADTYVLVNYTDYVYDVEALTGDYEGYSDFYFKPPYEGIMNWRINWGNGYSTLSQSEDITFMPVTGTSTTAINLYPFGYKQNTLNLAEIPNGSSLGFYYQFSATDYGGTFTTGRLYIVYRDADGNQISTQSKTGAVTRTSTNLYFNVAIVLDIPEGAVSVNPYIYCVYTPGTQEELFSLSNYYVKLRAQTDAAEVLVENNRWNVLMEMQKETNEKLDGIQGAIGDTNDKLDDTNEKLDGVNNNLETLPGEIGDEFQNVIDSENEKAETEGGQYVDDILDVLPDQSSEVLAALKSFTDATAYTGTAAVLPLPSLTIPAIGSLIPEKVLWEGGNLDFSEYFAILPSDILTLVQNLFTIAAVLYCCYELKGIISFCLTLRGQNKGGID